jgi:EAL domain-containing protein (putative c-di-GMP-specific phosphodiesterase class I)
MSTSLRIVRSTVDCARHLKLRVVAEGIETPEVLERLATLGCDEGQGYLLSRPVPAAQLTARLSSERRSAAAGRRPPAKGGTLAGARTGA